MDSEKLINAFEIKRAEVTWLFMGQFFLPFVDNFLRLLLCKIYIFNIFSMVDSFQIFIISRTTKILIVLNF